MAGQKLPLVSLVIAAKNEGENVKHTIESAYQVRTEFPFEIIVVDDGSEDRCCDFLHSHPRLNNGIRLIKSKAIGVTKARNLGARQAKGNYLIFCDAHLFFADYWIEGLMEPILAGKAHAVTPGIASHIAPGSVGYGQTLNERLQVQWNGYQMELFETAVIPAGCFIIPRKIFFDIGGFDPHFLIWGHEDIELSIKLWLFGYTCCAQPKVKILHVFRTRHPYRVSYEHVDYNQLIMAYNHFKEERIEKCLKLLKYTNPERIRSKVLESNVLQQRLNYFTRRKYDDDWFMKKFNIPF